MKDRTEIGITFDKKKPTRVKGARIYTTIYTTIFEVNIPIMWASLGSCTSMLQDITADRPPLKSV